jgi:hypothetical protein
MSLYKKFANDKELEVGGVWAEFDEGIELKMRRAGGANERYMKTLQRKLEPHQRKLRTGERLAYDLNRRLLAESYAEAVVCDWRSKQEDGTYTSTIEGPDGSPMVFSVEACAKLFFDLPDFFALVISDAENRAMFATQDKQADAKN